MMEVDTKSFADGTLYARANIQYKESPIFAEKSTIYGMGKDGEFL